MIKSTNKL
uniref:Uncharacterized protein n=1 Tax=Rhizophora mucronata TaxID=61149 RepID=A0A2P2NVZ1_RHIMU